MCDYKATEPNYDDLKPIHGEEQYVEYDEDTSCYGIFGADSGFCYEFYTTEEEANSRLAYIDGD